MNFANFTTFGQHAHVYRCTTDEHDAVRLKSIRNPVESSAVNNSLISFQENGKLIWLRPPNGTPFKGKPCRCRSSIITALLLLSSGDIQTNPGPGKLYNSRNLVLGSFNSRSAVNKAANIHDIISENNLDVLALQETWVTSDAPPAIKDDIAPPGFMIQHVHRPSRGGGLAIIHREHLRFRPIDLKWVPTTFEVQILQFHLASPLIIANIYQPSSPPSSLFFEELATLVTKITIESSAKLLVCGDLNCPGTDPEHTDIRLDEVLSGCGLCQLLHEPTRGNNLLDIIATSDTAIISSTGHPVDYNGVSDHKLLTVSLNFPMPESPLIKCSFRDLKKLNIPEFESAIRQSSLYTNPATSVDVFSTQLRDVITSELDRLCPVKTINRRAPKKNTKWLSEPAREAKRRRRRMEKKWKRTKLETDRIDY